MGAQPSYSDPLIIPITITIPDPRPKTPTGRWDQLGSSTPPRRPPIAGDRGGFGQPDDPAAGAIEASSGRTRLYDPPAGLLPDPPPSTLKQTLDAMLDRARRRAAEAEAEIRRGEYGRAAGQLLLGQPFPAGVDDPLGTTVHTEAPEETSKPKPQGRPELEQLSEELKDDLKRRLDDSLDERHLQAAEQDRLGNHVIKPNGDPYDHENEVAESRHGLEAKLDTLRRKSKYDSEYVKPRPDKSIKDALDIAAKVENVLNEIDQRLPGLKRP